MSTSQRHLNHKDKIYSTAGLKGPFKGGDQSYAIKHHR